MKYIFTFLLVIFILSGFSQIPNGYYDSAEGLSGEDLKAALHNIIDDHTTYPYTDSGTDVWDILKESDRDPNNSNNVILIYTGWSVNADQEYNNGSGWSREHIWAKSHGDFDNDPPPGTDAHHLRPCDISVNSARGNKDFDNGGTQHPEATECYTDADSWEPRPAVKGDVARMMFYMATRYEGGATNEPDLELVDYTGTEGPVFGKLSTLIQWNAEDPVDDFERNRNEVVYSYQGNRNPFVDHPEYVNAIYNPSTGNEAPVITDVAINPTSPTENDNVIISCSAVDSDGSIEYVLLKWKLESGTYTDINMNLSGGKYYGQIPQQTAGERVQFSIIAEDDLGLQSNYDDEYEVSEFIGIDNIFANNVKIYPNPTSQFIHIAIENYEGNLEYNIYNILGKLIKKELVSFNNNIIVDMSDFETGVYFTIIKNENDDIIRSEKIIKK